MSVSIPKCAKHPGRWSYGRDLCMECEAVSEAEKSVSELALAHQQRKRQITKQDRFMGRYCANPRLDDSSNPLVAMAITEIAEIAMMATSCDSTPDFSGGGGSFDGGGASGSF